MSDDIKERLDTLARLGGGAAVLIDAKSRIEALEAQLAAAREALKLAEDEIAKLHAGSTWAVDGLLALKAAPAE